METFDDKPTLDMKVYHQLCIDLGDEDGSAGIVLGLVNDYRADAKRLVADLRQSLAQNNAEVFQRSAHTLKSNSAMFGAMKLSAMSKALEEMGKAKNLAGADELLAAVETELEKVLEALPK